MTPTRTLIGQFACILALIILCASMEETKHRGKLYLRALLDDPSDDKPIRAAVFRMETGLAVPWCETGSASISLAPSEPTSSFYAF